MTAYHLFYSGELTPSEPGFFCDNDEEAVMIAEGYRDKRAAELWTGPRLVAVFREVRLSQLECATSPRAEEARQRVIMGVER